MKCVSPFEPWNQKTRSSNQPYEPENKKVNSRSRKPSWTNSTSIQETQKSKKWHSSKAMNKYTTTHKDKTKNENCSSFVNFLEFDLMCSLLLWFLCQSICRDRQHATSLLPVSLVSQVQSLSCCKGSPIARCNPRLTMYMEQTSDMQGLCMCTIGIPTLQLKMELWPSAHTVVRHILDWSYQASITHVTFMPSSMRHGWPRAAQPSYSTHDTDA